jgi:hypothetical protein
MNTSSFFTGLLPKHPEVTRDPSQAFFFAEDFGKAIQKLIQTKTITALGTVTPDSTTLLHLFDPMIHHNLSGALTTIIGNSINKKKEFSLVKIDIASFPTFPYIAPKKDFDPLWRVAKFLRKNYLGKQMTSKSSRNLLLQHFSSTSVSSIRDKRSMVLL